MNRKVAATLLLLLSITIFVLAAPIVNVRAPTGPSYTTGASPPRINKEDGHVIVTFTISGGTANTAYTFRFTTTKLGGSGQALCDESFTTDSTGGYAQVLTYPNNLPSWNAISGTH